MITLLVHLAGREAIKLEVEDIPRPDDNCLVGKNPREKTDRELNWIEDGVTTLIFPWHVITFVEVLPSSEEQESFPLPFRND